MSFQTPIPAYVEPIGIKLAQDRLLNPPQGTPYEHHVGSWAMTNIVQHFNQANWVITPEQALSTLNTEEGTSRQKVKKPDVVIEEAYQQSHKTGHQLRMHAAFELKKKGGDRFEKALCQLIASIDNTLSEEGYALSRFETFAVVMCGEKIGFFEYHQDRDNLDEEGIAHFEGMVSLTTSYDLGGIPSRIMDDRDIPTDLEKLYHNTAKLQTLQDPEQQKIREEAKLYQTPCILNITKHTKEIEYLLNQMENNKARSSV